MRNWFIVLMFPILCLLGCAEPKAACPVGQVACGLDCVDIEADPTNCGGCGIVCGGGSLCSEGACACPGGEPICDGVCTNVEDNQEHCGACGNVCSQGTFCREEICMIACEDGSFCDPTDDECDCEPVEECPGITCGEDGELCIMDSDKNPLHCGGCGIVCGEGQRCLSGNCSKGDLFATCFQAGQMVPFIKAPLSKSGPVFSGMEGPQAMAFLDERYVLALGTLDQTLYVVDRTTMESVSSLTLAKEEGSTAPNDVLVRGSRAYVLASWTNEVVVVELADPKKPKVVYSVSTGEGSNPYSAAFDDEGTLWVSLWASSQLIPIKVGETGGETLTPIEIAPEGIEGTPYPAGVATVGKKVYVSLNNLGGDWGPAGNGRLWIYDRSNEAVEVIDLGDGCTNPGFLASRGDEVLVPCTGRFAQDDGALVIHDPAKAVAIVRINTGGSPARIAVDPAPPHSLYLADSGGSDLILVNDKAQVHRQPVCVESEWEYVSSVLVR